MWSVLLHILDAQPACGSVMGAPPPCATQDSDTLMLNITVDLLPFNEVPIVCNMHMNLIKTLRHVFWDGGVTFYRQHHN